MFRFWRSFPLMVAAGLVVGLATGGFPPAIATIVQQVALILAMAFSLTEITFRDISLRRETRAIGLGFLMTYVVLGGILLGFASLASDTHLRSGWVLMAAVPPAIAVVPVTSFLRGNVRSALIAEAVLYLLGLIMVPAISAAFLGQAVPLGPLVLQTALLIGIPIVLSRPLLRWGGIHDARPTAVSVSFFFLVVAIAGSARDVLLGRPDLVTGLSALALVRTFGLGLLLLLVTRELRLSRDLRIATTTFAAFKNLGLTVVLAATVVGPTASLPAVVCLIFETIWMSALPVLFRTPARGVTEIAE